MNYHWKVGVAPAGLPLVHSGRLLSRVGVGNEGSTGVPQNGRLCPSRLWSRETRPLLGERSLSPLPRPPPPPRLPRPLPLPPVSTHRHLQLVQLWIQPGLTMYMYNISLSEDP